jgi:hypothetical protein
MVKNFTPINKRLCVIRIKGRFFNYSIINIPYPVVRRGVDQKGEEPIDSPNAQNVSRLRYARWSHDQKTLTYHKNLYLEQNPMEREIKEDRNPGERMG